MSAAPPAKPRSPSRSSQAKPSALRLPLPVAAAVAAAAAGVGFLAGSLLHSWRRRRRRQALVAAEAAAQAAEWRAESDLSFGEARQGATLDLKRLDRANPTASYSPLWSIQAPDCHAVVEGLCLPLHSGPLAAQCEILQDLIAAYNSGELASGSAVLDLSPMFKGASWREASCLLRFIYHPRSDASPANLAVLAAAGLLPGVARLAHCLDCRPVLAAVDGFLTGTINRARVAELIVAAQVSQACNSALKEDTLNLLARKLASAAHAAALPPPQLPLAALDSAALAHLLRRTLREVARRRLKGGRRGLRLFGIKRAPQHGAQQAAGTPQQAQGGAAHAARRKVKVRRRPY